MLSDVQALCVTSIRSVEINNEASTHDLGQRQTTESASIISFMFIRRSLWNYARGWLHAATRRLLASILR